MTWDDLDHAEVRHVESEVDTRRFGTRVSRLTVGSSAAAGPVTEGLVVEALKHSGSEVVVARWPAALTRLGGVVSEVAARVIPADTLMYWDVSTDDLVERTVGGAGAGLETRAGVAPEEVQVVLADSFRDYPSHYSANPIFSPAQVLEGYLEWAGHTLQTRPEDAVTLLRAGRAIGVATFSAGAEDAHLEVELAGLVAAAQGSGHYATLLHGVALAAVSRAIPRVVISTQASNIRVQRAWGRAGFAPFAAFTTVHVVEE